MPRGTFKKYHFPYKRGTPLNDAEKIMISIDTKLAMQKPEITKKMFQKGITWTPEQKEQMRQKRIAYFNNPENRKKTAEATKAGMANPAVKAKITGKNNSQYGIKQSRELIMKRIPWLDPANGIPPFRLGIKHTEETKEKIRIALEGVVIPIKDTKPEKMMQVALQLRGIKYTKHQLLRLSGTRHKVDIFIEPNICVEIDGDYWHRLPHQIIRDDFLNHEMIRLGYIVIRVWEKDILNNIDRCALKILSLIESCAKGCALYNVNLGEQ